MPGQGGYENGEMTWGRATGIVALWTLVAVILVVSFIGVVHA